MFQERKKIAYFNCTGAQPHIGCLAVTDSHLRNLIGNGYEVSIIYSTAETTKFRRSTREETKVAIQNSRIITAIEHVDAVVINGEGTIHHQRGVDLLCIAEIAKEMGKPVFIVNAVIEEMEGWFDILSNLDDLNVREVRSSNYLKENNVSNQIILDSFLDAKFSDINTQDFSGKTVVTDWHPARDNDVGKACLEFIDKNPSNSIFLPFQHWSYIENDNWRHQVANLSTADVLVTGRHHGVYAAILSGKPFVALPSNTYKIEGMVEFCSGKIPYSELDINPHVIQLIQLDYRPDIKEIKIIELQDLIKQMWSTNPDDRPDIKHVLKIIQKIKIVEKQNKCSIC